ncbi:hypothetical protein D9M68_793700 [compost metagenome]
MPEVVVFLRQQAEGRPRIQFLGAGRQGLGDQVMAVVRRNAGCADQVGALTAQYLGQLRVGADFQQQPRRRVVDRLNGNEGATEFQHGLTHSMNIWRAAGSRRIRSIRCLKMLMLRWQKADSGLRPSTLPVVA